MEKEMAYKIRMIAEYCNILATLSLVVIMTILLIRVLPVNARPTGSEAIEPEPAVETIDSMAYLASLCDQDGDECRPILYHPAGNQPLSFD
ncbi:MAG: hypothetical protein ABIH67_02430 [Candidatus Uhrbacteria bacterium]